MPAERKVSSGAWVAAVMFAFIIACVAFAGGWFLGGSRTVLIVQAPTHDGVAVIEEGRCAAGRCQTLRLGPDSFNTKVVESLSGPDEHASEIAWTGDGGRVGFLVNGYQLRIFDAHTGKNLGALVIVEPDGTPPSRIARGVTFSQNGAAITFDDCPRDHSGCKPGMVAVRPQ